MASRRTIIQDWMVAQKRHHLSDMQVQMARELGFKREKPEVVKSLKQQLIEDESKRKAKKNAKDARRAAKAAEESQCSPEVIEDSEDIVQLGLDSCGD